MALSLQFWLNYVSGNSKLSKRSEQSVEANHVLKFVFDVDLQYVRATVQSSMKDKSYNVEIQLEGDEVCKTSCECYLLNDKCHHIAATLLWGNVSKTDIKAAWLKNPKSARPKELMTIEALHPPSRPDYSALSRAVTDVDRRNLCDRLGQLGRFTAMHWILSPEPEQAADQASCTSIPLVEELLACPEYEQEKEQETWLRRQLSVTPQQARDIADQTTGQRDNPLWSVIRKTRFTASNFGDILRAVKLNRISETTMTKLTSSYSLDGVSAIQWGLNHEATAIESYCSLGAKVKATGIWLHESGVLAASPDGIVIRGPDCAVHECETLVPELLEVKCPFSKRDVKVHDAAQDEKFFLGLDDAGRLFLKTNHAYYHQIQGQLHITGLDTCDLFVWTTVDYAVIRICRDASWTPNIGKMINFYFSTFVKQLK